MILTGYHGTDLHCAKQIMSSTFKFKYNDKHWLGNGVYFYLDFSLARWWTTNPSQKFGVRVTAPAIVEVDFNFDEGKDEILDLRKLSDYDTFTKIYFDEFIPLIESGVFDFSLLSTNRIRCSFCDYLKRQYDLKAIIGNFSLPNQPYISDRYRELQSKMKLSYIETQLCVFDLNVIVSKKLVNNW